MVAHGLAPNVNRAGEFLRAWSAHIQVKFDQDNADLSRMGQPYSPRAPPTDRARDLHAEVGPTHARSLTTHSPLTHHSLTTHSPLTTHHSPLTADRFVDYARDGADYGRQRPEEWDGGATAQANRPGHPSGCGCAVGGRASGDVRRRALHAGAALAAATQPSGGGTSEPCRRLRVSYRAGCFAAAATSAADRSSERPRGSRAGCAGRTGRAGRAGRAGCAGRGACRSSASSWQ